MGDEEDVITLQLLVHDAVDRSAQIQVLCGNFLKQLCTIRVKNHRLEVLTTRLQIEINRVLEQQIASRSIPEDVRRSLDTMLKLINKSRAGKAGIKERRSAASTNEESAEMRQADALKRACKAANV